MNWGSRNLVLLVLMSGWRMPAQAASYAGPYSQDQSPKPTDVELELKVRVYNSAKVSASDLVKAEAVASNVFEQFQIRLRWELGLTRQDVKDVVARATDNQKYLHLRIWTRSMAKPKIVEADTLGFCFAVQSDNAVVLSDAVYRGAATLFTDYATLLGLAMAHELGHLLLKSEAHSSVGIMRSRIRRRDLKDAETGKLTFTKEQSISIQTEVLQRATIGSARHAKE